MTDGLAAAKALVSELHHRLDTASATEVEATLRRFGGASYRWRGSHPFNQLEGPHAVVDGFWRPLHRSFLSLQRRPDIFFAGANDVDGGETTWVASMGHFMGLFDRPWLDIAPTGKLTMIRYAEFDQVDGGTVVETALFVDVVAVLQQAGCDPLPPQTGASLLHPGPRTHDGLLSDDQPPEEGAATLRLVNRMIDEHTGFNRADNAAGTGRVDCPPELLRPTWHEDMAWYGPAGIGSTYTIDRYQRQHQHPFRRGLSDYVFNGHVARLAEGCYAGFFGWPNLTNRPIGGFLGGPARSEAVDMRVVDFYRRQGDKLAENWVFIDLLHWFDQQGLDLLARSREAVR